MPGNYLKAFGQITRIFILCVGLVLVVMTQANARVLCKVNPEFSPDVMLLSDAVPTNNLVKKAGALEQSKGIYIEIHGIVRDEECIPVPNAIVTIWQPDSRGHYEWEYDSDPELIDAGLQPDANFAYSGTAVTNNRGEYTFITLLPGNVSENSAPHINMDVAHDQFSGLSTRLYFSSHPRNAGDGEIKDFAEEMNKEDEKDKSRTNLNAIYAIKSDPKTPIDGIVRYYQYDIVLDGLSRYRRF
jgi:protocatechuate 3,4-dioxygenase beta subunit